MEENIQQKEQSQTNNNVSNYISKVLIIIVVIIGFITAFASGYFLSQLFSTEKNLPSVTAEFTKNKNNLIEQNVTIKPTSIPNIFSCGDVVIKGFNIVNKYFTIERMSEDLQKTQIDAASDCGIILDTHNEKYGYVWFSWYKDNVDDLINNLSKNDVTKIITKEEFNDYYGGVLTGKKLILQRVNAVTKHVTNQPYEKYTYILTYIYKKTSPVFRLDVEGKSVDDVQSKNDILKSIIHQTMIN